MEKVSHRVQKFRSVANVKAIVGQDRTLIGGGDKTWENWEGWSLLVYVAGFAIPSFSIPDCMYSVELGRIMNCKTAIVASLRHVARDLPYGTEETHENLSYESR